MIQLSIWEKPSLILQVTKDLKVQTFVLWSLSLTKKESITIFLQTERLQAN